MGLRVDNSVSRDVGLAIDMYFGADVAFIGCRCSLASVDSAAKVGFAI